MATANSTGAPVRADHPVDSDPSMNEALRRAQASTAGLSDADFAAHEAGTYYRKPPSTGRRDVAVTMSRFLGR